MKKTKDYINLLPPKRKKPGRAVNPWWIAVPLFVLVWTALFGLKYAELRGARAELAAAAARKSGLEQQLALIRAELGLTAAPGSPADNAALIRRLLKERVLWSDVFQQFSRIIPQGVWFDSLEGSSSGAPEIRIRGGAFHYGSIADFMLAMEQSGYFDKPQLLSAQNSVVQGREVIGFSILCGVTKPREAQ
jgi:Tfp pilus assembly protein PilN